MQHRWIALALACSLFASAALAAQGKQYAGPFSIQSSDLSSTITPDPDHPDDYIYSPDLGDPFAGVTIHPDALPSGVTITAMEYQGLFVRTISTDKTYALGPTIASAWQKMPVPKGAKPWPLVIPHMPEEALLYKPLTAKDVAIMRREIAVQNLGTELTIPLNRCVVGLSPPYCEFSQTDDHFRITLSNGKQIHLRIEHHLNC